MKITIKPLLLSSLVALGGVTALWAGAAQAAEPYVSATVEGALAPGVYGRVDIGNVPPPPLVYAQPLIIQPPPVLVQQAPLYLHVPPGHAQKWAKHCARYNACDRPVYFVKVSGDDDYERRGGWGKHHGHDEDGDRDGGRDRDDHENRHGRDRDRDERGGGHRH